MSEFNDIQTLLEKFWEGETSLEEERLLKSYFATGNVDARLLQFAPLFQAIREEQTVQLNKAKLVPIRPQMYWAAAASIAILLAVGTWWLFSKPETTTVLAHQPVMVAPQTTHQPIVEPEKQVLAQAQHPSPPKRKINPKSTKSPKVVVAVIDAEEAMAMEEIKAALALVSSKIRKGRHEAAKGATHLESVEKIFKKKEG